FRDRIFAPAVLKVFAVPRVMPTAVAPLATDELCTPVDSVIVPVKLGVAIVGDVPKTAAPEPVSSESTAASCAEVELARCEMLASKLQVPPFTRATPVEPLESTPVPPFAAVIVVAEGPATQDKFPEPSVERTLVFEPAVAGKVIVQVPAAACVLMLTVPL